MTNKRNDKTLDKDQLGSTLEQSLLIDDHHVGAIPKRMQVRLGSYLANLMIRNLTFKLGDQKFMLLKPTLVKTDPKKGYKKMGVITFNKGFIEEFIT